MKDNRRLGRGLAGLIGDNYDNKEDRLPISLLHPSKFQPRKYFDEESLKELAGSIEKNGIIQPIVVRKDPNNDGYEIVAGERRWRASKVINLDSVPVIIKDLNDKECLEVSIIENIQRQDINPIEEGEAYSRLIDEFSYTHEELALILGKSRSHITNMIRMLSLPDGVKTMINEKKLSMGHARALVNVKNAESIAKRIVSQGLSVRRTEKLIKDLQQNNDQKEYKCTTNQDMAVLEGAISSQLGLKIKINDSNSKGKVMIRYNNSSELDFILKILNRRLESAINVESSS
ncbi:MAG: ParB/RepB/Spo0J family partition protein [Wolbachia endosymbiont of Homalodisca vitripennis]|uniref:ParB/RepB/Spo0J family partition protein n=1 Tax=Wolbachia endosymbiont of Rhagoletis cingulata TaxID=1220542 RepID=UPI001BC2886B|nr:ParB/RepB/Spo0J family partition protein [Wolbachia endosymbiont of Homalodisca vitripennis]MCJ7454789.1 ParB/RepB/Spo0J family partition protein [Wolbachia endosymbiont of Homalodisca vitripennis]MCJ7475649.1 ParB/RepB/Spo0J family partition protein [Wolbachia endosymbiont of Homalodisca vitripennis]